jgi:hypothetical protein
LIPSGSDIDLRHREPPLGGAAIQGSRSDVRAGPLDCFVAKRLLAMTGLPRSNRESYQPTPTLTFVIASRRLAARQSRAGVPVFVQAPWIASSPSGSSQ